MTFGICNPRGGRAKETDSFLVDISGEGGAEDVIRRAR